MLAEIAFSLYITFEILEERRLLTSRVLLLNFSYEPLGTIGVARAVCLWFRGAIFVEEND